MSLVVFHRHGHRAPTRNVFNSVAESDLWRRLVPDQTQFDVLSSKIPIHQAPTNPRQRDLETAPFGVLTRKGLQHLECVGTAFAQRWQSRLSAPSTSFNLFATNYQRTQASGQSFVLGLLNSRGFRNRAQLHKENKFICRSFEQCSMQFYEGKLPLAEQLISIVQKSPEFRKNESEASVQDAVLALTTAYPALRREDGDGTPGLDWLAALDLFACRRGHGLLDSIPQDILKHEAIVNYHMAQRYQMYYGQDKLFQAHFALPILQDLCEAAEASFSSSSPHPLQLQRVTIFSCHDVNLLGLLYALQHATSSGGQSDGPIMGGFWPPYGCTLTFEVDYCPRETARLKLYLDQGQDAICEVSVQSLRKGIMQQMKRTIEANCTF